MSMNIIEMSSKAVFYLKRDGRALDPTEDQTQKLQTLIGLESGAQAQLIGATLLVHRESSRDLPEEAMQEAVLAAVTAVFGTCDRERKVAPQLEPEKLPPEEGSEEDESNVEKKMTGSLRGLLG